jgi:hypothetical protein
MNSPEAQSIFPDANLSVFHTRRLLQVIELPLDNSDDCNVILAFASQCVGKKQFQAFYCADKTLLLRSLEEDLRPRFWRIPWMLALNRIQHVQSSQLFSTELTSSVSSSLVSAQLHPSSRASSSTHHHSFHLNIPGLSHARMADDTDSASSLGGGTTLSSAPPPISSSSTTTTSAIHTTDLQHIAALEFSPEGDWLVVIVCWGQKTFLLVVPVAALVSRERKQALQVNIMDLADLRGNILIGVSLPPIYVPFTHIQE